MHFKTILFVACLAAAILVPGFSFCGGTMVYYGRPSGTGCGGTGVCKMGANSPGVFTEFNYVGDDGNGHTVVTMTFKLADGQAAGFIVPQNMQNYIFSKGYTFADPELAKACGVPVLYVIPDGYSAKYTPPSQESDGRCSLTITKPLVY